MSTSSKKDQLIETAYLNFYKLGFTATGVDKIIKDSGISKRTLYSYFPSKEDLIKEVLEFYYSEFKQFVTSELDGKKMNSEKKIKFLFDSTKKWLKMNNHYGCLAINAIGELNEEYDSALSVCYQFKEFERLSFEEALKSDDYNNAKELAFTLLLLLEGAIISSKTFGIDYSFNKAKKTASELVKSNN